MQRLENLAIAVDNTESAIDNTEIDNDITEEFGQNIYDDETTSGLEAMQFSNLEMFFKFICNDVNKENVRKMLTLMKESISYSFEKKNKREYY